MFKPNCIDNKPYYDDPFYADYVHDKLLSGEEINIEDVLCNGYIRVACMKEGINENPKWNTFFDINNKTDMLQIQENLIYNSNTLKFLAEARPNIFGILNGKAEAGSAEYIFLANKFCTRKNVKIIIDYLYQHQIFEEIYGKNTRINRDNDYDIVESIPNPKYKHEIEEFDRYYFLLNDRGRKKFEKLNKGLRDGFLTLKEGKLKQFIESEIQRNSNMSWREFSPEKLNNIVKDILNDTKNSILDPYAEAVRSKKYFRDREELEDLLACALFLEIKPLDWHLAIMRCKETNPIENDYRLLKAYPAYCQFSFFDIKQRIFLISIYEIILFAFAKSIIATTKYTKNSLQSNIIEKYECIKKKLIKEEKIANTNVGKKFYNIIMANNLKLQNFITDFESRYYSLKKTNVYEQIIKLPKNYDEPSMRINNDFYFHYFNEIDKILPKIILTGQYLHGRENIYSYYTKMIQFLLVLLAYRTTEGDDVKSYRLAFMDNPNPNKKYINGDITREVTVDTPYEDLEYIDVHYDRIQYRAYINQELIEHFFP